MSEVTSGLEIMALVKIPGPEKSRAAILAHDALIAAMASAFCDMKCLDVGVVNVGVVDIGVVDVMFVFMVLGAVREWLAV